ncbi:transglutaminase-like domain-containing protein [Luteolibacter sp. GHJ8]|uniref:Transglutaminase-like domain-containing protein n=1 Tax=Luteolibacter rhizosphaerae TaxID=2989719 RepID=A0ABT3G9T5_9BACT|nr:transglutaminase-like domain-containing protein [Luteolibacter rhizosphaerae]MCW1916600.1 transglutaminase-like domain-containing protein [Luteolibacter rhizosphaerae]
MTNSTDTSPERLSVLLRLLDDDSPPVRASVEKALGAFGGDVSELLGESAVKLNEADTELLSLLLLPARRERLRREWIVPAGGAAAVADDWDQFEALLRSLSDYLHDGVSLRQPLGDALDLIAEELEVTGADLGATGINAALFESGRFTANTGEEDDPDNYDLAHVLAGNPSNAVGLGIIFLLVAHRLEIDVDGLLLPRSLLCRYHDDSSVILSEPLVKGRRVQPDDLAHRMRRYPRDIRMIATRAATPGELLVRVVEELATAWSVRGEQEDAELMEELLATLVKAPF